MFPLSLSPQWKIYLITILATFTTEDTVELLQTREEMIDMLTSPKFSNQLSPDVDMQTKINDLYTKTEALLKTVSPVVARQRCFRNM